MSPLLCLLLIITFCSMHYVDSEGLVIVFVHTTIPGSCGPLPDHLKASLLQAQLASKNGTTARVVILGNFKQCRWALDELKNGGDADLKRIITAESMSMKSVMTQEWEKLVRNLVPKGTANEDLLLTSLYRYFMLDDYMTFNNITGNVLHLDADTMLYSDPATFESSLRTGYPRLGLTPSIHRRFLSASSLYVGSRAALRKMNAFFAGVASNKTSPGAPHGAPTGLSQYANWLRSFACCKPLSQGGLLSHNGVEGVRPWAVNDMTLLAFYRSRNHGEVRLFPLLPRSVELAANSSVSVGSMSVSDGASGINGTTSGHLGGQLHAITDHQHLPSSAVQVYAEGGSEAGPSLGGLVDCSSGGWGTHYTPQASTPPESSSPASPSSTQPPPGSQSPRATDRHAVVEQAVVRYGCRVTFRCSSSCVTVPFVQCNAGAETPLITLHLGTKNRDKAKEFASAACLPCGKE